MTLLQEIKRTHSDKFNQLIFLDKDSYVLKSCNSIFDVKALENKSANEWYPFIESIFQDVWKLDEQIRFTKVETTLKELPGTYDFTFARIVLDGKEALLWSIYNYTELYNDLKKFQQSRNELEIRRELIEKKYKKLVDFNEVLIEKNTELENINQLHQDYFRTLKQALMSPMNTLDSVNTLLSKNSNNTDKDYVAELKDSFQSIQTLVEELKVLNTSFSPGDEKNRTESFNVYELIVEVIDTFKENTTSSKQLIFHIDEETPEILTGKPKLLKQILYCLMMNSHKFDQDEVLEIFVKALPAEKDKVEILYQFKGSKSESLEKISPEKITEVKLRLELVKKLIEIQGGSISVELDEQKTIIMNVTMKYGLPVLT